MLRFPLWTIAVLLISGCVSTELRQREDLASRGWDLGDCGVIPASTYMVGNTDDYIPVTFVNDTGSKVHPAYSDLKGEIKFRASKSKYAIWKDRTYFGTNWVWFSESRKCLGWSASQAEWSDSRQFISDLIQTKEKADDISAAKKWMREDCELLGHAEGTETHDECLLEILEAEK